MSVSALLAEYYAAVGENGRTDVSPMGSCNPEPCQISDPSPCREAATHWLLGSPACTGHTENYLVDALAPYRKIEALMVAAAAAGLTVSVLTDLHGRKAHQRCDSLDCRTYIEYSIEGQEVCREHVIALIRMLLEAA